MDMIFIVALYALAFAAGIGYELKADKAREINLRRALS
jgi:hypothetical protein